MRLRGWTWVVTVGPAGLGNRPLLEALEVALPDEAVEELIERTCTRERRRRLVPTHLVVSLVVGMGLWAAELVRHVLVAMVDGWYEVHIRREDLLGWRTVRATRRGRARQRVGVRLFRELFHAVAGPIATPAPPGACLGGLRLMATDGTTLDVADTPENVAAFGWPDLGIPAPLTVFHRRASSSGRASPPRTHRCGGWHPSPRR